MLGEVAGEGEGREVRFDLLISLGPFKKGTDKFSSLINIAVKVNQKGVCNESY